MLVRIASALVLIPLALGVALFAPPLGFLLAIGAAGTLCLREYLDLAARAGLGGRPGFAYAGFWVLLVGLHFQPVPPPALLGGLVLGGFVVTLGSRAGMRERVAGMTADLSGIFYLGLCLYCALPIRYAFGDDVGRAWLVILLATIWVGDTAALFVGRALGRSPFAPVLSPKKTNEGAVGGLLGGTAAAVALERLLYPDLPLHHVVAASLVIGVLGQLGDLAESMLKRAAGVKDSSQLIPGHGGVLDRLDSLLFAVPALYIYLHFLYRPA